MKNETFEKLIGQVEADETLHRREGQRTSTWSKRSHAQGPHMSGKTMVIGAISRKGNVVCQMIEEAGFHTLDHFVQETVSKKSRSWRPMRTPGYRHLGAHGFVHQTVNHGKGEYVVGSTHTNTIEGFWSLLKRGLWAATTR